MKEIALTQGQVALVDDDIFKELNQHKWFAQKHRKTFYARRHSPTINGKRNIIKMHHEIIGCPPKGFEIDHKNGCGTDNQRHNLRLVTPRQNCQNLKNVKKTSQYPGVCWAKHIQKWTAQITINNIKKHLGVFIDETDAFKAYRNAINALGETVIGEQ